MLRAVPLSTLWVILTNFAAKTADGLKSDAIRIKATGDGIVIVNPDERPMDFDLYFVPASVFSVIFPVGMKNATTAAIDAIIEDGIAGATDRMTLTGSLSAYIDSVEHAVASMLPLGEAFNPSAPPARKPNLN